MYAYATPPSNIDLSHYLTIKDALTFIRNRTNPEFNSRTSFAENGKESFERSLQDAIRTARDEGWSIELQKEPRVFWHPYANGIIYGFLFAEVGSSNIIVVSQVPLTEVAMTVNEMQGLFVNPVNTEA